MRAYLPSYELKKAKDLQEVLSLLHSEPGVWRPFAGGTDIMVGFEAGKLSHRKFVNLLGLKELQGIEETPTHVTIGALNTYSHIRSHSTLRREFELLVEAAGVTGAVAIQNRGTLGGNIANASPAADSPPALLVYEAELELISSQGSRWVGYKNFHTGYKKMDLKPDELIARVRLPRHKGSPAQFYRKVGTRKAQAISKVCFAGWAQMSGGDLHEVRIALGSVAPTPIRCPKTEAFLRGKALTPSLVNGAQAEIRNEVTPIDDIRSTAEYRSRVTANVLEEFLQGLMSPRM